MKTRIKGGTVVNEGHARRADILIDGDTIVRILPAENHCDDPQDTDDNTLHTIDATGCYVLPGVIDSHVHFREPGLTAKACIESESRAAAAGGVTSFFDMPNTVPQTTTLEALEEKFRLAEATSHVNYSFFFGATNDNAALFSRLDTARIPGIKLFMGSSTGNMLVDSREALDTIFDTAAALHLPLVAHCEDTAIINRNMEAAKQAYGDDPPVWMHPLIRSEEACVKSTRLAIEQALAHRTQLHIAHISTEAELRLLPGGNTAAHPGGISAEATVGHLLFCTSDYHQLGARIKVNPAIKDFKDRNALRHALTDGRIATIATDHAPHLLADKDGGAARAASGMPMVQFSLVAMLGLADQGVVSIERLVELMCHNPATRFGVKQRGFLRPGYKADIAIVRRGDPWTLTTDSIESRCRWSPLEDRQFDWSVVTTICNGHIIYNNKAVSTDCAGQEIRFCHDNGPQL